MSYDIQLFRLETKDREQQCNDEHFFDDAEQLEPFTEQQIAELKDRLLGYDYELVRESPDGMEYRHAEYTITVLLTERGLYFTAGWDTDSIFEAGMTASEFTDTDEFAKYDPQNGGWE
ncbi:hypothetical protein [Niabella beijingensis]|uniref:hypothetical protein n=1 Tax=Niabella beijingensis TaxID=2872700 RepID=UPI001CC19F4E|nr:hypothetical protein [Niabella beijingensis]MBZ4190439.1 hypothetical protein [Niabella beijingensis]